MATHDVKVKLSAQDKLSPALQRVGEKLTPLGAKFKTLNDQFNKIQDSTRKIRASFTRVGEGFASTGRTMMTRVTAPVMLAGGMIIRTAAQFEQSMNKVQALTRASGDDFKALRDLAKQLGATTKFSASEAADAMAFLGMAGWKTEKILAGVPSVLNLAASSGVELSRAADIMSNIMGAFAIEADKAGSVADVMAAVMSTANVDMEMLAESMKYAGPVAKQFGTSLSDTAAAVGFLGNIGIQGAMAGTALRSAMLKLSAPTGRAAQMLKHIGVQTATSDGKMRDFIDIMADMGKGLTKLDQQKQMILLKEVFGDRAVAGMSNIQEMAASGALGQYAESLKNVEGRAAEMMDTMGRGATGSMKAFTSALEGLAIEIGDSGALEKFTDIVKGLTDSVRALSQTSPGVLKWGTVLAVAFAAMGPVLWTIGQFILVVPKLMTAFALVKTGILALGGSITLGLGPISVIIVAIAALGAAGIALYKNWDSVKEKLGAVWDWLAKKFTWLRDKLSLGIKWVDTYGQESKGGLGENRPVAQQVFNSGRETTNNAHVRVDFRNMPAGAKVSSASDHGGLDVTMGLQGAYQ
jgi:TP901 family phage tail tape measure protein